MPIVRAALFLIGILLVLAACLVGAFFYERNQIERATRNYISIWEAEIVHSLIEQQDKNLLEKIVSQLKLVSAPIENTQISLLSDSFRIRDAYSIRQFQIPVSVNYMTVGLVDVTLSQQGLVFTTILSPIFLVALFLVLGAAVLIWLRGQRAAYEQQALQQKIQQQTEIAQLARQVAHDIRSPLGALQIIASKPNALADDYKEFFNQGTERINQIANDLLEVSRSKKKNKLDSRQINSESISFDRMLKVLGDEFGVKTPNVSWNFQAMKDAEPIVLGLTEAKLSRILANLLQNSAEAKASKVDVQVIRRVNELILSVQDDGVGISESVLSQVFEKEISSGKENGNGIGLKSAKESLEKIGGRITLASKENQGTLVQMRIPIGV